jgi:Domain of unknown function (DUF5679)
MGKITEKKEAATTVAEATSNNTAYCVKCKSKKSMNNPQQVKLKNGANALQGKCETCGTKMTRILGKDKSVKPEG